MTEALTNAPGVQPPRTTPGPQPPTDHAPAGAASPADTSFSDVAAMCGAGFVAMMGFATSFEAVSTAMAKDFKALAPLVPFGIDAGILTSSLTYIALARRGEAPVWLRWIPHGLTAATVYLNWSAGQTFTGKVAHSVMVLLWAIAVEAAAYVARRRRGLETATRMERIRRSRWLLAPIATARLYRRMVLWETTSYRAALDIERARVLARADLRERHGRLWRWKAPYRERVLLRLGELAPASHPAVPALESGTQPPSTTPDTEPQPITQPNDAPDTSDTGPAEEPRKPRRTAFKRAGARRRATRSDEQLLTEAREADERHRAEHGRPISAQTLANQLHIGKPRANALVKAIRSETTGPDADHSQPATDDSGEHGEPPALTVVR